MPRYTVVRRRHHPLRNILLILLLAIVAYAACCAYSALRIYNDAQDASAAYQHAEQSLSSGDISSAVADVRTLSAAASDVGSEADSWVWIAGEYIPWVGEDVSVARGLAHVADSLCNDALLPVVEQYEGATSGSGSIGSAADAVSSAAQAVAACQEELDGLGTSHFSQLNDAKSELSQAVSAASGGLGGVSSVLGALSVLGGA